MGATSQWCAKATSYSSPARKTQKFCSGSSSIPGPPKRISPPVGRHKASRVIKTGYSRSICTPSASTTSKTTNSRSLCNPTPQCELSQAYTSNPIVGRVSRLLPSAVFSGKYVCEIAAEIRQWGADRWLVSCTSCDCAPTKTGIVRSRSKSMLAFMP
jgi:hypothetical protein